MSQWEGKVVTEIPRSALYLLRVPPFRKGRSRPASYFQMFFAFPAAGDFDAILGPRSRPIRNATFGFRRNIEISAECDELRYRAGQLLIWTTDAFTALKIFARSEYKCRRIQRTPQTRSIVMPLACKSGTRLSQLKISDAPNREQKLADYIQLSV